MNMFSTFNINASGMTAQRYRMDVIAENVANANTTRTADGTPYRRRVVMFSEKDPQSNFGAVLSKTINGNNVHDGYCGSGVKVTGVYEDHNTEFKKVYDPSHPDADEDGYVYYPNVDIVTEMTNMIDASRAYEANATAFSASKSMALQGLQIGE